MSKLLFPLLVFIASNFNSFCQNDWSVSLGKERYVTINYLPDYNYIPDGHISVLPDGNGKYMMYWSEYRNSRTIGNTQYPESQKTLQPEEAVFGGRAGNEGPSNGVNDGGSWLMSVHRHNGDTLIGFYHGESHWYPRNGDYTAWKSICLAYSYDNGYSWEDKGQIVTSDKEKPENRAWGGSGDCCVVWDSINNRWNCYFQENNIRLAVSYDPLGAPGTWKKYYEGTFDEDGLGGLSSALNNISNTGGGNPSVHWNTFYKKWVMVFHGWDGAIYSTLSNDGVKWDFPNKIILKGDFNNWYPTIIGESDTKAGKLARLYYAEFYTSTGWRFLVARDILFDSTFYNYGYITNPWKSENIGFYNFPGKGGIRNEIVTITGTSNRTDLQNEALYLIYQNVVNNGEISSRLSSQTDYNNKASSGLMLRESLDVGSKFISIGRISASDTVQISYRTVDNVAMIIENFQSSLNWFKIRKNDSQVEFMGSENGETWATLKTIIVTMEGNLQAGFFSTSHNNMNFCTATFENTVLKFDAPVGFNQLNNKQDKIYPNPVTDYLNLEIDISHKLLTYNIFGLDGRVYKSGIITVPDSKIEVIDLPSNQQYTIQVYKESSLIYSVMFLKL